MENDDSYLENVTDGTDGNVRETAYTCAETPEESARLPEDGESGALQCGPVIVTEARNCCREDPAAQDNYYRTGNGSGGTYTGAAVKTAGRSGGSSGKRTAGIVALCVLCGILGGLIYKVSGPACARLAEGFADFRKASASVVSGSRSSGSGNTQIISSGTGENVNITVAPAEPIEGADPNAPASAVAAKVLPSIVGIEVITTSTSYWYGSQSSVSQGSGVIFTEDGYIITNYHVISDMLTSAGESNPASTLRVFLYTDPETPVEGQVIGYDQGADLAVLKIAKTGLTAISVADSDELKVGEVAIAIGNPGGLSFLGSVSQGIISGLNRSIQSEGSYEDLKLIQTDAAINPGNSGGALVDIYGRLIGINSVKIASDGYEGMGFAIPVNDVVSICTGIIRNGSQHITYLGVELNSDYSAAYLERLGYPGGLLVESVIEGSPADKAGIRGDDIIVSFDGTAVTTAAELAALKNAKSSGDTVAVRVYRLTSSRYGRWTGEYIDLTVTLG